MGNEQKNSKKRERRGKRRGSSTGATIDCHKLVAHDVRVAAACICEFDELQPKDTSS